MKKRYQRLIGSILVCLMVVMLPMQSFAMENTSDAAAVTDETVVTNDTQPDVENSADAADATEIPTDTESSVDVQNVAQVLEYTYVESPVIAQGMTQNVLISLIDKNIAVDSATIWYRMNDAQETSAEMVKTDSNVFLFEPSTAELGTYQITKMTYTSTGVEYEVSMDSEGIQAAYSVQTEDEVQALEEQEEEEALDNVESSIQVVDQDGNVSDVDTLAEGLAQAEKNAAAADSVSVMSDTDSEVDEQSNSSGIVVVLDPGHDTVNTGAHGYIAEEQYTLLIAQACKEELEQYSGITVYMTRTGGTTSFVDGDGDEDLYSRDDWAKSLGADLFVSFHLNAATAAATGAEIYISTYSKLNAGTTAIANQILASLAAMGLQNRGIKTNTDDRTDKYDDGNTKDAFIVIRENTQQGIPAMLLEQGFVTNSSDASIISSKYKEIGIADATAIANYFGLGKGPIHYTPASGISMGESLDMLVSTKYMEGYTSKYRYIYREVNSSQWNYTGYTTDTTYTWTPSAMGQYWIGVQGTNSAGKTKQFFAGPVTVGDYNYGIDGISYANHGTTIDLGAAYHSSSKNTQFRFQVYNLQTKQWTSICDWYGGNWVTWTPESSGTYWVYAEMKIAEKDEVVSRTIAYQVTLPEDAADITGICAVVHSKTIDVGAAYTSQAKDLQFQWKSYNLATKEWKTISDWKTGNWSTWTPDSSGTYWLYAAVKTKSNILDSFTIAFQVTLKEDTANISGISAVMHPNSIDVGAAYTSTASNVEFLWKSYNLATKEWKTIQNWTSGNWATWQPDSKGTYWLHVEARVGTKVLSEYTIPFQVSVEAAKGEVTGISVVARGSQIDLGAAYTTNVESPTFRWQIYNLDTKSWTTLTEDATTNWTTWKPDSIGTYWVHVVLKNGSTALGEYTIGYRVDSLGYKIMGASSTSVNQMVQYYMANTSGYDVFPKYGKKYDGVLAKGGAANITVFCNMYWQEATIEGVKPEVAFVQAMLETGFLKYGGDVIPSQYNFAGIGTTGNGVTGNQFKDVREGIRAQIQHLKAYASTDALVNAQVDPRFHLVNRGCAATVEELTGKWATSPTYGTNLIAALNRLRTYSL